MGTRLGRPHPKPLTPLADGRSIMRQQLDHLRTTFGADAHVTIVVGFKMDLFMEAAAGDAAFVYNELYDQTNTCKSLLKALRLAPPGGVLWLNGDVVFVPKAKFQTVYEFSNNFLEVLSRGATTALVIDELQRRTQELVLPR